MSLIVWYKLEMELFHVLSRGVDKRQIFMSDKDYLRFLHNLYVLNDEARVNNVFYLFNKINDIASHYKRSRLVDIHTFCLMPNHFHLLLSPILEKGVSKFMKKLNMAYAKYFNQKHDRVGALFQGRYKSISIYKEAHFAHLPFYIHCNPLDMFSPEWRDGKLNKLKESINFLEKYRWSSHIDYLGKNNFPHITNREFLLDCFGGSNGYKSQIYSWLKDLNLESIQNETLEI